ncbi:MAG: hypothetical protein HQM03_18600 [Magnetococcales bacterium]|nr:hypothetical protein [Magnetococcales bacterium]
MLPLEILKRILHPNIIVTQDTSNPEISKVTLKENDGSSKIKPICLSLPVESIVFKFDEPYTLNAPISINENSKKCFQWKSAFLNPSEDNIHKGCDYVIYCRYKMKDWFVLVELKSHDLSGARSQLRSSAIWIRYLREWIYFYNGNTEKFNMAFVCFHAREGKRAKEPGADTYSQYRQPIPNIVYYQIPQREDFFIERFFGLLSKSAQ